MLSLHKILLQSGVCNMESMKAWKLILIVSFHAVPFSVVNLNNLYNRSCFCKQHMVSKFYCIMCGSRKYPYPPHGGSRNFLGVGGSKKDKFPKGRGVHKEFFFPEGLKCERINTYVFFPIDSANQEKRKVLSVEIDVGFLVIYFLLLFRRQTTHTALRHTSKYHV